MNIKKTLAALLAVGMLAGCSSATSSAKPAASSTAQSSAPAASEKNDTPAASGAIAMTVWAPSEDVVAGGWLEKELAAFKEAHPEWNIEFKTEGVGEDKALEKVSTDPSAAADVYLFANDQIPSLVNCGGLARLGGATLDMIKANNSETTVNTVSMGGAVYGVPFTANTWFMYYDKRVFTEDDVKSLDTMLEKGKVSYPLSTAWYFAAPYVANGCTLFGADGTDEAAGIDFSGDKAVAVTNYLIDLAANPNFVNYGEGSSPAWLSEGKANCIFSGTWDYNNVVEAIGEENVGICPAPSITIDGEAKQLKAFAGSKAIGVNPNSKNMEQAVALAAFLGSTDAQKDHFEIRNIIPTDNNIDVSSSALAKAQLDTMDYASTVQPIVSSMGKFWDPAAAMGNAIVNGDVTHDNAAEQTELTNKTLNSSAVE